MIHTGTIMDISKSKAYVFTKTCEMVLIRSKNDFMLGQQVTFSNKDIVPPLRLLRLSDFRVLAAAALLIVVIGAVLFGAFGLGRTPAFDTTCAAVISIDVNPSIEMSINKDNRIIDVVYANDEGKEIFDALDLKMKPVEEGIDQIVILAKAKGFLDIDSILFISAAPNDKFDQSGADQLKGILKSAEKNDNAEIVAIYIDDSRYIDEAKENDISIGRLLLHKYAEENGYLMSLQEIKDSSISDIFGKLSLDGKSGSLQETAQSDTTPPAPTPTDTTVETTSPEASPSPSLLPSPSPSPSPSPAPSPLPSPSPSPLPSPTAFSAHVLASASNQGVTVSWNKAPSSEGFQYYKVVASLSNKNPTYPEDGYAVAISDINKTSVFLKEGCEYNRGDVGGALDGVKTYYFSVTYVYKDTAVKGNAVKATMPSPSEPSPAASDFTPGLAVSASNSSLNFSWTPLGGNSVTYNGKTYKDFDYYKVVASETDSTPVYPDNGYIYYTSETGSSGWSVDPSSGSYNKSPTLEAGQTYNFAVTYVFGNGKFVSNTVTATVPGYSAPAVTTFSSPALSVSSTGGMLTFSWSALPGSTVSYNGTTYEDFQYYKVVASETNPYPIYPDDGYICVQSDLGASGWSTVPADAGLESGKAYYFAITYVFGNGKFVSNTVQLTVP